MSFNPRLSVALLTSALVVLASHSVNATDIAFPGGTEPNSCGEVNNQIPAITTSNVNHRSNRLRCVTDIDALKLTLHKAALCTSAPDRTDPSTDWETKCVFIIDDPEGFEFTVTNTTQIAIPDTKIDLRNLVEGTYTHAVLMVGNAVKTKSSALFTDTLTGSTGNGKFCYSLDATDPGFAPISNLSSLATKCVDSEADMIAAGDHGFTAKEFTYGMTNGNPVNSWDANTGDRVHVFADLETIATVTGSRPNVISNATKVAGVMTLASPAIVSPASTTFNAGFQLTGQGQLFFNGETGSACDPATTGAKACITAMRNYGVGFRVTVD